MGGRIATKRFDPPRYFAAFLQTLRWNCVTATDPAGHRRCSRGLSFQAHCADLFDFDLPGTRHGEWRNVRIDRKLQPEPEIRCHYFALPQRF